MATYNGGKYLAEQLESLFAQTVDFRLVVQDDGSSDDTREILSKYQARYPEVVSVSVNKSTLGAANNFLDLMVNHKSDKDGKDDYTMLCDQDDVWLPNKIEITLAEMKRMEQLHPNEAILIFTDLHIVDKDLNIVHRSYKKAMHSDSSRTSLPQVLIQNLLTGCTAMYNRKLSDLLTTIPNYCIMHDWWLLLVASAFGKIGYVNRQTILYRQHGKNSIGATNVRKLSYKLNRLIKAENIKRAIRETYTQAESFSATYNHLLDPSQQNILHQYISIPHKNKLGRWLTICKLGSFKIGFTRNIAYFIFI